MQQENQPNLFNDLSFDQLAKQHIRAMAGWATTVAIVAIIGYALSLFMLFAGGQIDRSSGIYARLQMGEASMPYTIGSIVIGLILNFLLFRFASQAKSGIEAMNQQQLSKSFGNLKSYFLIICILMLLVVVMAIVGVLLYSNRTVY